MKQKMTKFEGIYIYVYVVCYQLKKVHCGNCNAVSTFTAVMVRVAAKGVLQLPSLHLFSLNSNVPVIRNKQAVSGKTIPWDNTTAPSIQYILKSHTHFTTHSTYTGYAHDKRA